jgi:hypothetical protein
MDRETRRFWRRFFFRELFIGDEVEVKIGASWFCEGARGKIAHKQFGKGCISNVLIYQVRIQRKEYPKIFEKKFPKAKSIVAGWFEREELEVV